MVVAYEEKLQEIAPHMQLVHGSVFWHIIRRLISLMVLVDSRFMVNHDLKGCSSLSVSLWTHSAESDNYCSLKQKKKKKRKKRKKKLKNMLCILVTHIKCKWSELSRSSCRQLYWLKGRRCHKNQCRHGHERWSFYTALGSCIHGCVHACSSLTHVSWLTEKCS